MPAKEYADVEVLRFRGETLQQVDDVFRSRSERMEIAMHELALGRVAEESDDSSSLYESQELEDLVLESILEAKMHG